MMLSRSSDTTAVDASAERMPASGIMRSLARFEGRPVVWIVVLVSIVFFAGYKLHDFNEAFAYGHLVTDAHVYWHGVAHLDLGITKTKLLHTIGVTDTLDPIFYLSAGPLAGILTGGLMYLAGAHYWTVRLLPLSATLANLFLLVWLGRRLLGGTVLPYVVVLYVVSPFFLKYGSSNVGYLAYAMTLGLAGYVFYVQFLETQKEGLLYVSMFCFALGLGFTWQPAFMAAPVFIHIALSRHPIAWKVRTLGVFLTIIVGTVAIILGHQGLATGEYSYPILRMSRRAGGSATWLQLAQRQAERVWDYFGPALSLLAVYWFVRWLSTPSKWVSKTAWIPSFGATGLVYSFLLKDAAYKHDYLLLTMGPAFVLAAAAGALDLLQLAGDRPLRQKGLRLLVFGLLGVHVAIGMHSARGFERYKAADLDGGLGKVALFLRDEVPQSAIIIADKTAVYQGVTADGRRLDLLKPHFSYLTRRPIHYADDVGSLGKILREAREERRLTVLVQDNHSNVRGVDIPAGVITQTREFGAVRILFLEARDRL